MNQNLRELIIEDNSSNFKKLNTLIDLGVIKLQDAVKEVIDLKDAKYIYNFAR